VMTLNRTALSILVSLGLSVALLGCNSISTPAPLEQSATSGGYILTLKISETDSASALETRYNGHMLAYHPEAGFAMLLSLKKPTVNDPAVTAVEDNRVVTSPVKSLTSNPTALTPQGSTTSMSGWTSWAGGWTAWSGGWTSWAGGWTAWSGGITSSTTLPELPSNNQTFWNQIKLYEAHRISRKFGAGIKVAVIDTGIDLAHPLFQGHLAPSSQWKDYVGGDANPQEVSGGSSYGHGTAVAGIILQVAPQTTILPIRVLRSDGSGNTADIVSAISYAVSMGARVINISAGTDGWDESLFSICKWANTQEVMIVTSAGNSGQFNSLTSPAQFSWAVGTYGKTIGIGSVNSSDVRSSFSAYGSGSSSYFGLAPGEQVWSAYPGNQFANFTGTSFAAPMFAGAIALVDSEMPNPANYNQITNILWSSMDFVATVPTGAGQQRLNLERLIRNAPGWTEPTSIQSGVYNLVNVNSNKCLDVFNADTTNGAKVIQWGCNGGNNQKWKIEPVGAYYKLTAVHSGRVLEVNGASTANGAFIDQWDYVAGANNELWNITKLGSGFQLVAVHSGKNLDVQNFGTADGTIIQQTAYNGSTAQQFRLQALF
jgi:thermitase